MSYRSAALLGAQQPRVRLCPALGIDRADGDEAVDLASAYGLVPDPWQADVVGNWMARTRSGRLASGTCGLAVPRQNGKNGILEVVELHKMVAQGRRILHTAHEVKTARKAFLRLKSFFENERLWPELAALVKEIRQTNGQEAIVLHHADCDRRKDCGCIGGASVEFVARSRGSGRGFTVDDLVCDEAQELTDEQLEALMPTISASPTGDPQVIFTGTPPPPGSPGTVFMRIRTEGVAGKDKRLCWDEWSIPDDMDTTVALHSDAAVHDTNPAIGRRLNRTTTDDERKVMSPAGFCRERLGRWSGKGGVPPTISANEWDLLKAATPPVTGPVAVGVKFSLGGKSVAVCAARKPVGGKSHLEVLAQRPMADGLGWLVVWLAANWRKLAAVAIDGKAGRDLLLAELIKAKVPKRLILLLTTDQVITAHAMALAAVQDSTLTHANQPGLNASVASSAQRKIGLAGGWGWEPIGEGDVLPLEAATLALWAVTTSKRSGTGSVPKRIY